MYPVLLFVFWMFLLIILFGIIIVARAVFGVAGLKNPLHKVADARDDAQRDPGAAHSPTG